MLKSIYNFEIYLHLKRPFIWAVCLLMFLQGIFYMRHSGEFYANGETYANASAIFFTVFAGIGYVGFIVTAILAGTVITKDLQYRFSSILFTTSASESGYFWGRYSAGFMIMLGLNFFYLLGAFSYSFLPVKNLGPIDFPALLAAVLYILIPNTFILYTFCFSAAALSRNVKSSYLASMFIMLFMIFAVSMYEVNRAVALYDPTSFGVLLDELTHMSPTEKNTYMPSVTNNLMWNRLGWIFLAGITLFISRKNFSFKQFSKGVAGKKQIKDENLPQHTKSAMAYAAKGFKPQFSLRLNWKNVFSLSLTEFKSVVAPVGFRIFLGLLLIIYICYIAVWQQQYYSAAPTLPVTVEVVNITIALSFYFQLFIIINTVELLFRNRTSEFWKIADALPIPSWVTILSKVNAMILVSIVLSLCLIIFGMGVQAAKGYYHFEPVVYFKEVIMRWLPKYVEYILLCVAVAGIWGNKYLAHGITMLVLIFTVILHEIGVLEQHRFAFTFSPGALKYTDMNGSSFFGAANLWYGIYWIAFGLVFAFIGLLVWPRGLVAPLTKRFRFQGNTFVTLAVLLLISMSIFVYASLYIYRTVNVENQFSSKQEDRKLDAVYEKTYKKYEYSPQPQIRHIDFMMNITPDNRTMNYTATIKLYNPYPTAIDTLHIEWMDFLNIENIVIQGNALKLIAKDEELRHAIYKIEKPIQTGSSVHLKVKAGKHYQGFTNDDPQLDIAFNGSFMDAKFLPFIGYDSRRELADNKYREEYGLKKMISELPKVGNEQGNRFLFASTQSQQFTYNCTISVSQKQQIVMPGVLVKTWQKNGKNYYRFKSEKPLPFQINILSAVYASQKQNVSIKKKNIAVEIYYHPGHPYNIEILLQSAKEALLFLYEQLGEYPYQKLLIAERPRYDENLFVSGNLMALPENHGWIADINRKEDQDYLRYVTTQLIAEQYFQRGYFARVQGFPFLTKSIPGYLALVQMDKFYGETSVKKFLKNNHDKYLAGRAVSGIKEQPVLFCDENQDYIYNRKGIELLHKTGKEIGAENLLNYITTFYRQAIQPGSKLSAMDWYEGLQTKVDNNKRDFLKSEYISRKIFNP